MGKEVREVMEGAGWAAANVDDLSDEPGFRKVRRAIGVTAFGINAIERPVIAGGKDGYVGRDGQLPEGETRFGGAIE